MENRCECPSSSAVSLVLFYHLTLLWSPTQERWEDCCRLQDPGRLSAPSRVGTKRRLGPPNSQFMSLLLILIRRRHADALGVCHGPTTAPRNPAFPGRSRQNTWKKGHFNWLVDIFPSWCKSPFQLKCPGSSEHWSFCLWINAEGDGNVVFRTHTHTHTPAPNRAKNKKNPSWYSISFY